MVSKVNFYGGECRHTHNRVHGQTMSEGKSLFKELSKVFIFFYSEALLLKKDLLIAFICFFGPRLHRVSFRPLCASVLSLPVITVTAITM